MPVWGALFVLQVEAESILQSETAVSEKAARQCIERLVKYLETIQEP